MKNMILILLGLLVPLVWISPCPAHPHVFVEPELEIELGEDGVKGLWHHWTFDEYFSAWIIEEFDQNKDGLISTQEAEKLYNEAFKNLEKFGFWTRVLKGDENIPVTRLEEFSVEIKDNLATYSFFLPLDIPVTPENKDILILAYDEDYYCQIFFPPGDVGFRGDTSKWDVEYSTQKVPDLTYYFGFITPVAVRVSLNPS
ncbi:MAG: DUF1007 family protein [Desulfonatronovibrio sp.]